MNKKDLVRYIRQAERLFDKQCELNRKYCGGGLWIDGNPSWCLGPYGILLMACGDEDWVVLKDSEYITMTQDLLEIVERDAGDVMQYISKGAFQRHMDEIAWSDEEVFPNMTQEEITVQFIKNRRRLKEKYKILIKAIKKSLEDASKIYTLRYVKEAEKLWKIQTDLYRKYYGGAGLDGSPAWVLGLFEIAWGMENDSRLDNMNANERRELIPKLLKIVECRSDYIDKEIIEVSQKQMNGVTHSDKKKNPSQFIKDLKELNTKYQKLINEIKGSLAKSDLEE